MIGQHIDDYGFGSNGTRAPVVDTYPFTSPGKYEGSLLVQGKSGGLACNPGATDTVIINVIP
jgi:hypothetical protein